MHVQHMNSVLSMLLEHQLYVKEEKCEFHMYKVAFLGYIFGPDGVLMDQDKVSAINSLAFQKILWVSRGPWGFTSGVWWGFMENCLSELNIWVSSPSNG